MAETRSLTTSYNLNNSGFKKGMDEVVNKLNEYNKALVENQYKQRDCNKAISEAKKHLKELEKETDNGKKADEEQRKQMEALNRTIEEETVRLSQLRTEQASIRSLISQTTRTLTEHNDQWTVLKGTLANLASDTLQKLGRGLKNIVSDVIRTGESFSASMSEVGAISGATAEELQQLEDAARLYGSTTRYSATEAADALKYMALAGWNAQQSIDGLPAVLNLAAASGMDLGKASDIVTDYITAFGLSVDDAARFVDIMSYAMSNSNTTTEMLGEAYKNCAATAHSMGISVEEVTAVLMTMANAGVKGGEAGTTLNTLMTRLATDTKGCASALKEYGVEVYDAAGSMNSLSDILSGMVGVWDTLTQEQQANLSKMIAGTNQYAGFQTVMQGMSKAAKDAGMSFDDYTKALESCDGTAQKMASTMSDNLSGDMKAMQSALDELKLKIFDDAEQPLRNIVQWITRNGIPALEALVKNIDKIIPVVVAATAAMVSYKAALAVESIIKGVQQGLAALRAARIADTAATEAEAAAHTALNTAQAANPIGLLVGAIGGLAAGLVSVAMMTNTAAAETKNYNQELEELLKKQSEAEADAAAEAKRIELLKTDYDELKDKTSLTVREKERLNAVCEELAGKLGITTEELKTQEGAYRDLTGEVENYIRKLKEQARYEYYSDIIAEAQKSAVKAEDEIQKLSKAIGLLFTGNKKDYDEALEMFQALGISTDDLDDAINEAERQINEYRKQIEKANAVMKDAEESYLALGDSADDATDSIETLNETADDGTKSLEDLKQEAEESSKKLEELAKESKNLQSQSNSLRSEMSSLANSMKQLESGEALSLSTLLDLIDKYPEYAAELSAAAGNADLQKQALEKLFEAKKNDYILTQQAAIDNIEASKELTKQTLSDLEKQAKAYETMGTVVSSVAGITGGAMAQIAASLRGATLSTQIAALKYEIGTADDLIESYQKKIELVRNMTFSDLARSAGTSRSGTGTSGSGSVKTVTEKEERNHTYNYKDESYTATYSFNKGEYDAVTDADTAAKAYLGVMDRAKALGKMTVNEEIRNLQSLVKWENISSDQRYEIRQKLYKAQQELAKAMDEEQKKRDEASLKAAEEAAGKLTERQNLALAAYNRLVNGRIEALNAESKAAQENADKQIAAIDAVMQKRRQEQEDEKRQKELDLIDAKLQLHQIDEITRMDLERRKQDILNEQANVSFERMMENQKGMISGTAAAIQNKNAQAIAGLQAAQAQASDRIAYLQGRQTYDQRVSNNPVSVNISLMQNGMTNDQFLKRLSNEVLKALGA